MEKDTKGFYQTIAWWLPKKLVYFAGIRLWANASTGKWSNEEAPKITLDVALQRWDKD